MGPSQPDAGPPPHALQDAAVRLHAELFGAQGLPFSQMPNAAAIYDVMKALVSGSG